MRQEKSDLMFVEWSKGRSTAYWDTQTIAKFTEKYSLVTGLDIGGGIGTFANAICDINENIKFIDIVEPSIDAHKNFINHPKTNLLKTTFELISEQKIYDFITINLVCHHIIGKTNSKTLENQISFLKKAKSLLSTGGFIFVEENIYDSYFSLDICGRLIYEITSIKGINSITRRLGANTAGEGVRFHSDASWIDLFKQAELKCTTTFDDLTWGCKMPIWQKYPLLCKNRFQRIYVLQSQ